MLNNPKVNPYQVVEEMFVEDGTARTIGFPIKREIECRAPHTVITQGGEGGGNLWGNPLLVRGLVPAPERVLGRNRGCPGVA